MPVWKRTAFENTTNASRCEEIQARAGQFHQVKANQADIDYITGDSGHADAVAHANSISSDDEKIRCHGEQNGLQANSYPGSNKSGECCQRAEFADETENQDNYKQKPDYDPAQHQELAAAARVADIAEGDATPDFRKKQNDRQRPDNPDDPQQKRTQDESGFAGDGVAPLLKIRPRVVQNNDFLAKGKHDVGELFEALRQFLKSFALDCDLLRAGCGLLIRKRLAFLNGCPHRLAQGIAKLIGYVARVVGFFFQTVDFVRSTHVVVERHRFADQAAGVGECWFCGSGSGGGFWGRRCQTCLKPQEWIWRVYRCCLRGHPRFRRWFRQT